MSIADPILQVMVIKFEQMAKDGQTPPRLRLELLVSGIFITGELVSALKFQEEAHRTVRSVAKAFGDVITETAMERHTTEDEVAKDLPHFLHLRGIIPSSDASTPERLWRIRISSVDGFHVADA